MRISYWSSDVCSSDLTAGVLGAHAEVQALFTESGEPSDYIKGVLDFCQKFEESGARTKAFMEQLTALDLLMDGEIAITQNDNPDKPFIYRGFRMVDENKLRELPAEKVHELNQNGILMLIHAHLFRSEEHTSELQSLMRNSY